MDIHVFIKKGLNLPKNYEQIRVIFGLEVQCNTILVFSWFQFC